MKPAPCVEANVTRKGEASRPRAGRTRGRWRKDSILDFATMFGWVVGRLQQMYGRPLINANELPASMSGSPTCLLKHLSF